MACFVYHTKSCPRRRLILVLTHGESLGRPVSSAFFSRFALAAIGSRDCLPSCESSLCSPLKKEVQ
eukprot:3512817-Ditylum_brightwellii.AAC.1